MNHERELPGVVREHWPVGVVALAFVLLFGTTILGMLVDWSRSGEYGHGFLLLPIAGYLAWKNRVSEARPAPLPGVLFVSGAVLLFLLGSVASEFFTRRLAVLIALAGVTITFAGVRQLRVWWLPFGLLLFTIPLPEVVLNTVTLPLQLLASRVAVALLEFRHVPVQQAGNIILLPGQQLFVAEACSGLRSVSALLGLTLLIAGTGLGRPASRAILLLLAVPAALVANALRVFATGFASYYMGPEATEGLLHQATGIAVFFLALGMVGGAMWGLRRLEGRHLAGEKAPPPDRSAPPRGGSHRLRWAHVAALAVLMLAGLVGRRALQNERPMALSRPLSAFPTRLADFEAGDDKELGKAVLKVLAPDDYLNRSYRSESGTELTLFIAYYERQRGGSSIHSPRNCLPGSGWEPVSHRRLLITTPYGARAVNRYLVEHKSGARALVFYWYQGRGRVTANEYVVKWELVRDAVLKKRTDEALVRLVFPLPRLVDRTPEEALEAVNEVSRVLAEHLPA